MSYVIYNNKRVSFGNKYVSKVVLPPELINRLTGFVNGPVTFFFDTFVSSGIDITSAIEAPGTFGKCRSNTYPIISSGSFEPPFATITAKYYLNVISGTAPGIEWFRNGSSQGQTFPGYSGPGEYSAANIIFQSGDWAWGFVTANSSGVNFSATNCRMFTQNN